MTLTVRVIRAPLICNPTDVVTPSPFVPKFSVPKMADQPSDEQLLAAVATLTTKQILDLLAGQSGSQWLSVSAVIKDNDLDGEILADYIDAPDRLKDFFKEDLESNISKFIANQLIKKLRAAATRKQKGKDKANANANANAHAQGNGADQTAVPGQVPKPVQAQDAQPQAQPYSLRVVFTNGAKQKTKRLLVDVLPNAPKSVVVYSLVDRLNLPLHSTLMLTKGVCGQSDTVRVQCWRHFCTCLFLHQREDTNNLLNHLRMSPTHPLLHFWSFSRL